MTLLDPQGMHSGKLYGFSVRRFVHCSTWLFAIVMDLLYSPLLQLSQRVRLVGSLPAQQRSNAASTNSTSLWGFCQYSSLTALKFFAVATKNGLAVMLAAAGPSHWQWNT